MLLEQQVLRVVEKKIIQFLFADCRAVLPITSTLWAIFNLAHIVNNILRERPSVQVFGFDVFPLGATFFSL